MFGAELGDQNLEPGDYFYTYESLVVLIGVGYTTDAILTDEFGQQIYLTKCE